MIGLPIFMYHHVSESLNLSLKSMEISPDKFECQMRFLYQKGFRCLSLSEVTTNWEQGRPQPNHSFVLTFDDAYIDFYENAAPILKKFGFNATVFVVAKPVEEGNQRYLSWQEMRELAQDRFTFGSHTMTHPSLTKLDNTTIKSELIESKEMIEDRLGLPVELFAYPYGDSDERVRDIARQCGYRSACGVTVGHLAQFNLWRVSINQHESESSFYLKVRGAYYLYNWLKEETQVGRIGRKTRAVIWGTQEKSF